MRFLNACKRALKALLRKEPRITNNNNDRPTISVPLPIGTTSRHNARRRHSGRRQRIPDHADFVPQTLSQTQGSNANHHVSSTVSNIPFNVNSNIQRRAEVLHNQHPNEADPSTSQVTHIRVSSTNNAQASSSRHGTHLLQTENAPRRHGLSAIGNVIGISTARGASHSRQVAPASGYTNARSGRNQPSSSSETGNALHDQFSLPAGSSHTRYWPLPPITVQPPLTLPEYPSDVRPSTRTMRDQVSALFSALKGNQPGQSYATDPTGQVLPLHSLPDVTSSLLNSNSWITNHDFSAQMSLFLLGHHPDLPGLVATIRSDLGHDKEHVILRRLRDLDLTTYVDPYLYLDYLTLPKLQRLSLTWQWENDPSNSIQIPDAHCIGFNELISRSLCSLTELCLVNICPLEYDLLNVIRQPRVTAVLEKLVVRSDWKVIEHCGRERRITDLTLEALPYCTALKHLEMSHCYSGQNTLANVVGSVMSVPERQLTLMYSFWWHPSYFTPRDVSKLRKLARDSRNRLLVVMLDNSR
ncbi:hypothetical protein Hypma_016513 [Hypsizygus marmoreus]|uniref:Uncharacterized protein n=1 Tax=Hypsizygus marmoreus TaxID=39966 RepID=A0A369IZR9_HYPMA|nr:hypothetical protein Hypma_016513 [Hypsizygus marmoreus]